STAAKPFMDIRRALWSLPAAGEKARPAFAVSGAEVVEAFREVYAVLVEGKKPRQSFPHNSNIYVAFFSYQSHPYVRLHKVERQGVTINVRWRFVPHETEETTEHFALIPLGKLPSGQYRVNIIRSPMEKKFADRSFRELREEVARRVVCGSFSFAVLQQGEQSWFAPKFGSDMQSGAYCSSLAWHLRTVLRSGRGASIRLD
ncbi:MAG: hypothetical protein L0228_09760, partial [Planctomycetes bacterium]|nr:hypothetical protein [Planctomycetota bacterium]